jgi:hypothetical protein
MRGNEVCSNFDEQNIGCLLLLNPIHHPNTQGINIRKNNTKRYTRNTKKQANKNK